MPWRVAPLPEIDTIRRHIQMGENEAGPSPLMAKTGGFSRTQGVLRRDPRTDLTRFGARGLWSPQRGLRGLLYSRAKFRAGDAMGPRPPKRAVSTVFRPRHRLGKTLCITPPSGAELGRFLACAVVCLYAVPYRAVVQYLLGVPPAFPVHADIHMETGGKFRMGRNVHRLEIEGASGACPESPACAYGLLWNSSSSRHESGLC